MKTYRIVEEIFDVFGTKTRKTNRMLCLVTRKTCKFLVVFLCVKYLIIITKPSVNGCI